MSASRSAKTTAVYTYRYAFASVSRCFLLGWGKSNGYLTTDASLNTPFAILVGYT